MDLIEYVFILRLCDYLIWFHLYVFIHITGAGLQTASFRWRDSPARSENRRVWEDKAPSCCRSATLSSSSINIFKILEFLGRCQHLTLLRPPANSKTAIWGRFRCVWASTLGHLFTTRHETLKNFIFDDLIILSHAFRTWFVSCFAGLFPEIIFGGYTMCVLMQLFWFGNVFEFSEDPKRLPNRQVAEWRRTKSGGWVNADGGSAIRCIPIWMVRERISVTFLTHFHLTKMSKKTWLVMHFWSKDLKGLNEWTPSCC